MFFFFFDKIYLIYKIVPCKISIIRKCSRYESDDSNYVQHNKILLVYFLFKIYLKYAWASFIQGIERDIVIRYGA
jgi:hypothetical protein